MESSGKEWDMLIGEYKHTIDEKNRISLPVKFRKELGKNVVVTPGLDTCLFIFTLAEWKKITDRLGEMSLLQSDTRSFNRYLLGGATEVAVDTNGRILLPDFLKDRANLKQKAVFVGVNSRVEIWDESTWTTYKQSVEKQADSLAERLGSVGML
jgi:MraZ protein